MSNDRDRGRAGDTGATGTPGATGASGATGAEGREGKKGSEGESGLRGERGRPGRLPGRLGLVFLATALLVALVLAMLSYSLLRVRSQAQDQRRASVANKERIVENRRLIRQIEADRIATCQQTYEGVREVLRPFLTPSVQSTPERRRAVVTFNRSIEEKKRGCAESRKP